MKEAKRYDAAHLRYEDSNIRYGEGCEVEVVAAYDYDELKAVSCELLEALEEVTKLAISGDEYSYADWGQDYKEDPRVTKAKAAIAKARSEA